MTDTTASSSTGLKPITTRPGLREYLGELRDRSEYIRAVPLGELRAQNLDTVLGNLWFFLTPLLQTGVFFLIFGVLLEIDRGVGNYPVYLIIGVLVFRFFSQSLTGSTRTMRRNETLMRSLYFPRAIIPLASTLSNFYAFIPGVVIMLAMVVITGEPPSWRWLVLPVPMLFTLVFVAGVSLIMARLGHRYPDLENALPPIIRLGFYGSGVLYAPEAFTSNETVLTLFDINPMYQLISLFRWSLMAQPMPDWFWLSSAAYAVITFVFGFVYFWQNELSYGSQR